MLVPIVEELALSSLISVVVLSLAAVVVSLGVVFVFYGHPRPWWTHRSFDVGAYADDDLYPRVAACLRDVLVLKAAAQGGPRTGPPAATMSVADTGVVSVRAGGSAGAPVTACAAMYAQLLEHMPALERVDAAAVAGYTRSEFLTGLVDLADDASVRNARPHPVALAVVQVGEAGPAAVDALVRSTAGFLLSSGEHDLGTVREGLSDSGLATRARAFLTSAAPVRPDDPYIALFARGVNGEADAHGRDVAIMARALTAVADLALLRRHAMPQVRTMRFARRPSLDLADVVWLFAMPYLDGYLANVSRAIAAAKRNSQTAYGKATALYDSAFGVAYRLTFGESATKRALREAAAETEGFANPLQEAPKLVAGVRRALAGDGVGVYVDSEGRVRTSEAFVGTIKKIVKAVTEGVGLLAQIGQIFPHIIKAVMALVRIVPATIFRVGAIFGGLVKVGVVTTLVDLAKAALGIYGMVQLTGWRVQFTASVWLAHMFLVPCITVAYQTCALCSGLALSSALALGDVASGGVLRYMARNEDHPEGWWATAHSEDGNRCDRIVGSLLPCATGYAPDVTGLSCRARSRCRAAACPSVSLVRGFRTGAYRSALGVATGQRVLPNASFACAKQARAQAVACTRMTRGGLRTNGISLDHEAATSLVRALCVCRAHVLPGPAGVADELARLAMAHDPLRALLCTESAGAVDADGQSTTMLLPGLVAAAVTLACVVLAFARTDQIAAILAARTR